MTEKERPTYRVIFSGQTAEETKRIARLAAAKGIKARFISSLEAIYDRLRRDPLEFGEYRYGSENVSCHIGAILPVAVQFAVHRKIPVVGVQKVILMESSK